MDWNLAIEKNRDALKRTLAMLVAMAGFSVLPTGTGAGASGVRHTTLPRHLHRFVLGCLRPAEAAARRLIIIAARGLVVELPPPRMPSQSRSPVLNRSNGFGTGVVIRPGPLPEWARAAGAEAFSRTLSLPLLDPLKRYGVRRGVKHASCHASASLTTSHSIRCFTGLARRLRCRARLTIRSMRAVCIAGSKR